MQVPAVLDHVDAVISAHDPLEPPLYLGGAPPTSTAPYYVLYPDPGTPLSASLADDRVHFAVVVQITCVGASAEQALNMSDRSRAVMSGPLNVAGRVSWRPEALDGQPVKRDDDVSPPLFYTVARYRLRSTPS